MIFREISCRESAEWDRIVKSFAEYDAYYLCGYVKAFRIHGDGEPMLIYFENDTTRAINVVMKRDIASDRHFTGRIEGKTNFDLATPYGYGGFLIEGNDLDTLNHVYGRYCLEHNYVSEFVRFHPVLCNAQADSAIYDVVKLGRTITMELSSPEQIWNNLSGKNRNVIRKAGKAGVEIFRGQNKNLYREFMKLYRETMDRDAAKDYYYFEEAFYDCICEDLKDNSIIFYALLDNKMIAMSVILFANHQMHYHLSASSREYPGVAANNLLLYEAACWGCENGYRSFHLGGGLGSREDSLFKFKEAFNKDADTCFSVGRRIFNQELYDKLVEIRKSEGLAGFDENTAFFPKYRG